MKKWRDVDGYFSEQQGVEIQKRVIGNVCVELGSFKGRSTICLAEVAEHVYTVDSFLSIELAKNVAGYPVTYYTMSAQDASKLFKPNSVDFIFEDTTHDYATTKGNVLAWWDKLKLNGVLCFHDYGHKVYPDIKRIVHELFGSIEKKDIVGGLAFICKKKHALAEMT